MLSQIWSQSVILANELCQPSVDWWYSKVSCVGALVGGVPWCSVGGFGGVCWWWGGVGNCMARYHSSASCIGWNAVPTQLNKQFPTPPHHQHTALKHPSPPYCTTAHRQPMHPHKHTFDNHQSLTPSYALQLCPLPMAHRCSLNCSLRPPSYANLSTMGTF